MKTNEEILNELTTDYQTIAANLDDDMKNFATKYGISLSGVAAKKLIVYLESGIEIIDALNPNIVELEGIQAVETLRNGAN